MNSSSELLPCKHAQICGVCTWIQFPYSEQKQRKIQLLRDSLAQMQIKPSQDSNLEIPFHSVGMGALRDRVDLTFEKGQLGFFQKEKKEAFNLDECPLLSDRLWAYLQAVQKTQFPIQKGSIRLRVSPDGLRGAWLDFANEDIRDLLAEKSALSKLLDLGFVEIGQRRKKLGSDFKLKDPEFHPWTRTFIKNEKLPLYSTVGSFSQSGDLANQKLIQVLESYFENLKTTKWVEFGSGFGNLTFPLSGQSRSVRALEFDHLAIEGLKRSLKENPQFQTRIQIEEGDFQRKAQIHFRSDESVLVNPPRSGLQKFLDPLFELSVEHRPKEFIYMSCFLESFQKDAARLQQLGYRLNQIAIVDQFPQSPHFEILSSWILSF